VGARFARLLRPPNWIFDRAPEARRLLEALPRDTATEPLIFWSNEKFWRKPVVAMSHVVLHDTADATWRFAVVASKQLYASHYHDASLELMAHATHAASGRSYVFLLTRTKADTRPGGFGWLERKLLNRLVRRRLEDRFEAMRARLQG
jgi:hypothetical protein